MRYLALATDYDGTIAHDGRVDEATLSALERVRASGRQLVLVTGRELDDLERVFPHRALFDRIVAENGAVIYDPETNGREALGAAPPPEFVRELMRRGVTPLSTGQVIVATWEPHETTVVETIRDLGLELQVIFNKGAVMVLPTGINKASGLEKALADLNLSPHNALGIGDAENDQAFLSMCECSVAVANALDSVKQRVDHVTLGDHGAGVSEVIAQLLESDLREFDSRLSRHHLLLGHAVQGDEVRVPPFGDCILVAGPSGAGKTTVTTSFLEQLAAQRYQFCIIDPEGDYRELPKNATISGSDIKPLVDAALEVLAQPGQNLALNLFDLRLEDRPEFLAALLPRLQEFRVATGRPHWIVIDEAHHLLPRDWEPASVSLPGKLASVMLVTVHPDHVSAAALEHVSRLLVVGRDAAATALAFARGGGDTELVPPERLPDPEPGETWLISRGAEPVRFKPIAPESDRRRHRRKYAEGELGPDKSFYFRGPGERLNLRAHNLTLFIQLAQGVDEETWVHHLVRRDYSTWIREAIKDKTLADEVATIEHRENLPAAASRDLILSAINERYTAPQ